MFLRMFTAASWHSESALVSLDARSPLGSRFRWTEIVKRTPGQGISSCANPREWVERSTAAAKVEVNTKER
jgi:hypothetical protein